MTKKEEILQLIRSLPEDVTTEGALEALSFYAVVDRGLDEATAGKLMDHRQAKERLAKWLKPSNGN